MAYHGFRPAEQAIQIGDDEILSSHISDGVIVNADVNASAAIATSKVSGAVTSIGSHGLGSLATLSAVASAQITDGTIVNADVNNSAAIATSKLSGSLTSVGSHGLATSATTDTTNADNISSGTLVSARLDADTAHLSTTQTFSGAKTFTNDYTVLDNTAQMGLKMYTDDTAVLYVYDKSEDAVKGRIMYEGTASGGANRWLFRTNASSTNALILDSSSNATFAGKITTTGSDDYKYVIFDDGTNALFSLTTSNSALIMDVQTTGWGAFESMEYRADSHKLCIGSTPKLTIASDGNASFAGDIKFTGTTAFNIGSRSSGASAWLGFGGSLNNLKIGASDFTAEIAEFNMSADTPLLTIKQTSAYNGIRVNHHESGYWGSISTGDSGYLTLIAGGNRGMDIRVDSQIRFFTQQNGTPVQRMTMDSAGEFGIGTTAPAHDLHVERSSGAADILIKNTGGESSFFIDGTTLSQMYFSYNGSHQWRWQVQNGGALSLYDYSDSSDAVTMGEGNASWTSGSDVRMKENIVDEGSRLQDILDIQVRRFDWKHSGKAGLGFIAQELNDICPEAVVVGDDEVYEDDSTDDSHKKGDLKNPWQISKESLVPALVKAVQELSAKVTALENA